MTIGPRENGVGVRVGSGVGDGVELADQVGVSD